MKRKEQLDEINRELSVSYIEIKLENMADSYSGNKSFENVLRDLLNCIFEWELENGNYKHTNQKGFDLIDYKQKILVQVSSENTFQKVQSSLDKLEVKNPENWKFYFFLIAEKNKLSKKLYKIPENVEFNPQKNIWDMKWLIKEIHNLDYDKIAKVYDVLCKDSCGDELKPRDIWNGVYKDYKTSIEDYAFAIGDEIGWQKNPEGFVEFDILERLLPNGYISLNNVENNGINEKGEKVSLRDLINQESYKSMTIIGEGGIGKTTFLRKIMNRAYQDGIYRQENRIPIYIELSRTPSEIAEWFFKNKRKSNFIIRYIAGIVYDLDWLDSSPQALDCYKKIKEELQRKDVQKKYVLLLDGLNEVSKRKVGDGNLSILEYLEREIIEMSNYSNLTIILTSRRIRQAYGKVGKHVIELVGVQDEDVKWYLEKAEFSQMQINRILMNKELMACLRVPLFLCMFGNRKVEGAKTPCSRGEILYNFFHRDSPYYNDRLSESLSLYLCCS